MKKRSAAAKSCGKAAPWNPPKRGSHSAWKSRKRRGSPTFRTASTTTTLTIAITFRRMQPPASLRSEHSSDQAQNTDRDQIGMLIGFIRIRISNSPRTLWTFLASTISTLVLFSDAVVQESSTRLVCAAMKFCIIGEVGAGPQTSDWPNVKKRSWHCDRQGYKQRIAIREWRRRCDVNGAGRIGMAVMAGVLASIAIGAGARGQADARKSGLPGVVSTTEIAYPVNTTTTGMVSLLLTVDASGSVQNTLVLQDTPPLTAAAQAAVQNWKFKAASVQGKATEALLPVYIVFNPYNPAGTAPVGGGLIAPRAMTSNGGVLFHRRSGWRRTQCIRRTRWPREQWCCLSVSTNRGTRWR